jgi:DNA-binding transcriptional MerR regulator
MLPERNDASFAREREAGVAHYPNRRMQPSVLTDRENSSSHQLPVEANVRTISEVAGLLDVDRETVKSWIGEFSDHMSEWAQPESGQTRLFTDADTRTLALIHDLWEVDPDLENIHACLNAREQHSDRYVELVHLDTPIFQDVPNDIDETWNHGVLLSSMWVRPVIEVARAYKYAADKLVEEALSYQEPHHLDYPIFFNYRHSLELYLKIVLDDTQQAKQVGHDLAALVRAVESKFGKKMNEWAWSRLREFSEIDPSSDLFRYADRPVRHPKFVEIWVDFCQLKAVMDRFCESFEHFLIHV